MVSHCLKIPLVGLHSNCWTEGDTLENLYEQKERNYLFVTTKKFLHSGELLPVSVLESSKIKICQVSENPVLRRDVMWSSTSAIGVYRVYVIGDITFVL